MVHCCRMMSHQVPPACAGFTPPWLGVVALVVAFLERVELSCVWRTGVQVARLTFCQKIE
jgi:hypothetical protein